MAFRTTLGDFVDDEAFQMSTMVSVAARVLKADTDMADLMDGIDYVFSYVMPKDREGRGVRH